jgi:hypothetical protein
MMGSTGVQEHKLTPPTTPPTEEHQLQGTKTTAQKLATDVSLQQGTGWS